MVIGPALTEVLQGFSDTVAGDFTIEDVLERLAHSAVRVLDVAGAGLMVPSQEELLRFSFATGPSVEAVAEVERLQEHLQDGPCQDSFQHRRAINIADLEVEGSWPAFQAYAVAAGLRAVTAVPLLARGQRWGVLDLYRAEPRRLDAGELAAALTLAQVATSYLVITADRDAARQAQQEFAVRAMHDPLTGLPVRWVFLEQLAHAVAGLARRPGQVGVLFADVDGLKYVNDTYGHDAGDRLLITCVERIRAALRPTDLVARIGGDEFVVLLEDLTGAEDAAVVARRVIAELACPHRLDGRLVQPSASLGLALTDDPGMQPAALVSHADSAMYRAKRAGRGRYEFFDAAGYSADQVETTLRRSTTAALRTALRERQLRLHYQPIFELGPGAAPDAGTVLSGTSGGDAEGSRPARVDGWSAPPRSWAGPAAGGFGRVHALEALVRWQHPERGLLTAEDFVPDAERAGLMPDLGAWVLQEACEQLVRWDVTLGTAPPPLMFVNVSADELTGEDFARHLSAVLARTGVAPGRLVVEITETGAITDAPCGRARSDGRAVARLRAGHRRLRHGVLLARPARGPARRDVEGRPLLHQQAHQHARCRRRERSSRRDHRRPCGR